MSETFLIIDDDVTFVGVLTRALQRRGYQVLGAHNAEQARTLFDSEGHIERVLLDLKLEHSSGLELIPELTARYPDSRIVILTGYSSIATAVEAVKLGACNYLCKPANTREILAVFDSTSANPQLPIAEQPPSLERLEWEHIQKVLTEQDGNISATARALNMHRRTLQRKLSKKPVKR